MESLNIFKVFKNYFFLFDVFIPLEYELKRNTLTVNVHKIIFPANGSTALNSIIFHLFDRWLQLEQIRPKRAVQFGLNIIRFFFLDISMRFGYICYRLPVSVVVQAPKAVLPFPSKVTFLTFTS